MPTPRRVSTPVVLTEYDRMTATKERRRRRRAMAEARRAKRRTQ